MSNLPIWDAHVKKYGPPPVVVIPKYTSKPPEVVINSQQLSAEMEAQAELDEKNLREKGL